MATKFLRGSSRNFLLTLTTIWIITVIISAFCINPTKGSVNDDDKESLDPSTLIGNLDITRPMTFVCTMDGTIHALDTESDGNSMWKFTAGTGKLVSSSLSKIIVNVDGKSVQMIPGLDGSIFQFDGNDLEAMSFNADSLLASSSSVNDDTYIVGGKRTETFGVGTNTGEIKYACGTDNCNKNEDLQVSEPRVVIRFNQQIVRAVEMKSGAEKWNFSIGSFELMNPDPDLSTAGAESNVDIQIVVPTGLVSGVDPSTKQVLWKKELGAPVAAAWTLNGSRLRPISLFDEHHVPALSRSAISSDDSSEPMLYLGRHGEELYVQPSVKMLHRSVNNLFFGTRYDPAKIQWKPYLATAASRTPHMNLISSDSSSAGSEERGLAVVKNKLLDYPYDNGFYLMSDACPLEKLESNAKKVVEDLDQQHDPSIVIYIVNGSILDYWWQIVLLMVLTLLAYRHYRKTYYPQEVKARAPSQSKCAESQVDLDELAKDEETADVVSYDSRFLDHFKVTKVLGQGGFGIVFEAMNTLDETPYAVKRIKLPDVEAARKRVLREVTSLAKLDHPGIVRYYQSWEEHPPRHWQNEKDKEIPRSSDGEFGLAMYDITTDAMDPYDYKDRQISLSDFNSQDNLSQRYGKYGINPLGTVLEEALSRNKKHKPDDGYDFVVFEHSDKDSKNSDTDDSLVEFKDDFSQESGVHSSLGTAEISRDGIPLTAANFLVKQSELSSAGEENSDWTNNGNVPFSRYDNEQDNKAINSHQMKPSGDDNFQRVGFYLSNKENSSSQGFFMNRAGNPTESGDNDAVFSESNADKPGSTKGTVSVQTDVREQKIEKKRYNLLYIQMQLCQTDTLKEWLLDSKQTRERSVVLDMFHQIVAAVQYVHGQGFMHRDLKPGNIFFAPDGAIKIGDFGLVREHTAKDDDVLEEYYQGDSSSSKQTTEVGTQLYMSPEQLRGETYSQKVDIFALGVIFFEMVFRFKTGTERIKTLTDLRNAIFPEEFKQQCPDQYEFISWLCDERPDNRPTAEEILNSQMLQSVTQTLQRSRSRTISQSSNGSL